MAHMVGAVEGDRLNSLVDSPKGSQGLGVGGLPVAGRGTAWVLSGGLAARPGAGPVGVEPRALVPQGRALRCSPVHPRPAAVEWEVLSYSAAAKPRFPTPVKVGAAFESLVKRVRRL